MLQSPEVPPSFELLERAIRLYFDFLRERPQVVRLLAWSQAIQVRQSSPRLLDPALCKTPMDLGAQRLAEAQAAGQLRGDIPPVHVIKMFLDLCLAWHMTVLDFCIDIGVDPGDADAVSKLHGEHLEYIVELVRSGLTPASEPASSPTRRPSSPGRKC
jgi:hypothetical protein